MEPAEKTKEQLELELQILTREHEELKRLYRLDLSERLKAEAALKESEANLSAVFNATDESIYLVSAERTLLGLNEIAAKRLGGTQSEFIGKKLSSLLPPDVIASRRPFLDQTIASKESISFEDIRNERWMANRIYPILDDVGQVSRMAIFSHDVTDRKNGENAVNESVKALYEANEKLEAIVSASPDGIGIVSLDGKIKLMSEKLALMYGYPIGERNENIGKTVFGFIDPSNHKMLIDNMQKLLAGEKDHDMTEYIAIKKDNSRFYVEVSSSIMIGSDGKPSGILFIERDITERKQNEEELRSTKNRLESIINGANIGTWEWNIRDGETVFNKKWAEIIGYSLEELQPVSIKTWYNLAHPDDLKHSNKLLEMHLAGKLPFYECECRMKHKDGHWVWILDRGQIVSWTETGQPLMMFGTHIDISERKGYEAGQQEVMERHNAMIANISDVIGILGADGIFKYVSPNLSKMFGWQPEEFVGATSWQWVHTDDVQNMQNEFASIFLKEHTEKKVTFRLKCKDGSYKPIESMAINLVNDPVINGILINFHDITARKAAEDLLEQTRQNYETFFNTIDDFLFILDEQGNMVHVNSTVINRLGYSWDDLSGKSVLMVHPPERRAEAGRIVGEMLMKIADFCPVPLKTKLGLQIPVETKVKQGIWDCKPAIFGVTKDISRIQLSEEKFSKLFHLNPSACGLSDLETHQYIEVNEAFYLLLGFDKNEVIGKTAYDLGIFTPEAAVAVLCSADSNGKVTNIESCLKAKNGELKHVLLSAENIYVQDKKYRFTVVHDITERKEAEEALKKSESELRAINATKDKFFSIIAHDLKSPFQAIMGFSELLVEYVRNKDYDEIDEFAGYVLNSSKKALDLLMNLMEWTRSQTGRMDFNPEYFEMEHFLYDIVPLFENVAGQKSILIITEFPSNIVAFADKDMISTVIRNLITNAIKFTQPGGKITLTITLEQNGVLISVRDSGVGIPEKMIGKLFRIDQSYSTTGTNNEQGTGLGLILCKEFVEKHGGKIWVESEEGKGSSFIFTLPDKGKTRDAGLNSFCGSDINYRSKPIGSEKHLQL